MCCLSHSHASTSRLIPCQLSVFFFRLPNTLPAIAIRRQSPVPFQVIRFVLGPIRKRDWRSLPPPSLPAAAFTHFHPTAPPLERPRRCKRRPADTRFSLVFYYPSAVRALASLPCICLSGFALGFLSRRVLLSRNALSPRVPLFTFFPLRFSLSLSLFCLIHFLCYSLYS